MLVELFLASTSMLVKGRVISTAAVSHAFFNAALAIAVLRNTHQPVGENIFRPPPSNFENPSVGTGGALLS